MSESRFYGEVEVVRKNPNPPTQVRQRLSAERAEFHASHDQSSHGNWAKGGGLPGGGETLRPLAEPDGGFTLDATTLAPMTTGWAVAIGGTDRLLLASGAFDNGVPTPKLVGLVRDRIDAAVNTAGPDGTKAAIGGWHNPADGKLEVNVTVVFPNTERARAERFAVDNDQISMADLDAITRGDWDNAIVNTGGTGGNRDIDDELTARLTRFRVASTATVVRHE